MCAKMKTSEKHAHGCCLFLGSKVHLLSAIVFVHIKFIVIIKSIGIFFFFFFKKPGYSLLEVLFTVLGTVSRSSSHQSTFSKVTFFRFLHGDLNPLSVLGSLAKQLTFINSFAYEPQETDAQSSQCVKNGKACGFPGFVLKCCRCWIVL